MLNEFKFIIDGQSCLGEQGKLDIINPVTNWYCCCKLYQRLCSTVNQAAAKQASKAWQLVSHDERKSILNKITDGIEKHAEMLAELVVLEQGKPLALTQMGVQGAIGWTRYAAALDLPVEIIEYSEVKRIERRRQPLGVVASITSWNWPLMIAVWHIMPASVTAICVVVNYLIPDHAFQLFMMLVVAALVINWLMISVTHLKFTKAMKLRRHQTKFKSILSPWSNYLTIGFVCFILIIMAMTPDMRLAVILGSIWLAVLALMYVLKYRKKIVVLPEIQSS